MQKSIGSHDQLASEEHRLQKFWWIRFMLKNLATNFLFEPITSYNTELYSNVVLLHLIDL